jgi:hypothetical protein
MYKPGYVSLNRENEAFVLAAVDALRDASMQQAKGVPASTLALNAYDALQYDFPV